MALWASSTADLAMLDSAKLCMYSTRCDSLTGNACKECDWAPVFHQQNTAKYLVIVLSTLLRITDSRTEDANLASSEVSNEANSGHISDWKTSIRIEKNFK